MAELAQVPLTWPTWLWSDEWLKTSKVGTVVNQSERRGPSHVPTSLPALVVRSRNAARMTAAAVNAKWCPSWRLQMVLKPIVVVGCRVVSGKRLQARVRGARWLGRKKFLCKVSKLQQPWLPRRVLDAWHRVLALGLALGHPGAAISGSAERRKRRAGGSGAICLGSFGVAFLGHSPARSAKVAIFVKIFGILRSHYCYATRQPR